MKLAPGHCCNENDSGNQSGLRKCLAIVKLFSSLGTVSNETKLTTEIKNSKDHKGIFGTKSSDLLSFLIISFIDGKTNSNRIKNLQLN